MPAIRLVLTTLGLVWGALLLPPAAGAHGAAAVSAGDHAEEDRVFHTPAREDALETRTAAVTAADADAAALAGEPDSVGAWGPVADWPVVGVHVALMPDGRVLAYDSVGDRSAEQFEVHDHTRATIWDPMTEQHTPADVMTGFNVFCSGLAHLLDGSLLVAGGNADAALSGIRAIHVFDAASGTWSLDEPMRHARWYPSVTPLGDGRTLIAGGRPEIPEIRNLDGSLEELENAEAQLPLYPWLDVAPDGTTFLSGPGPEMAELDLAEDPTWNDLGARDSLERDYGSRAMFDIGRILVAGGGPSSASARVIDLNGPEPVVTPTESMQTGRRQHNLTVLADGTVLATGGNSSGAEHVDLDHGAYSAELWSPASGEWRTLASMAVTRQYHSTALLLPDGRVLSAGGGLCKSCDDVGYLAKSAEVYSPPYLFERDGEGALAARPEITAPESVGYDQEMLVATPDPRTIEDLALVRLGAVTHSVNMEQRYVPLEFSTGAGTLSATSPARPEIAPPGVYMLFAIDRAGVPSVARMIKLLPVAAQLAPPRQPEVIPPRDMTPPETRITRAPGGRTRAGEVRFAFSADEAGVSYGCRLDAGRFRPCESPHLVTVGRGRHRFAVRATDSDGNADPSPARRRFRVSVDRRTQQ